MHPSLKTVGLVDLLDSDPRATFVVALPSTDGPLTRQIVHHNPALAINSTLLFAILALPETENHTPFWSWVSSASPTEPSQTDIQHSLSYFGICWTKNIVRGRWVVVSGNEAPPSSEPPRKIRIESGRDGPVARRRLLDHGSSNGFPTEGRRQTIVRIEPDPGLMAPEFESDPEPFLDVIHSVDWDKHVLGPMDQWPLRLQQAFNQMIPESRAIAIYWGPQNIALYNESFSKYCGTHHPRLLGNSASTEWPYLRERLDKVVGSVAGKCTSLTDESRFFIEQPDGTSEETYARWSLTPIMDNRQCLGVQHSLLETTSMRLWERRMKMLLELGDALVTARNVKSYWTMTLAELERASPSYDVPLAFMYSVSEDDDDESSASRYDCPRRATLEGALGVPEGHPIAPATLELRDMDSGLAPMIRESLEGSHPLLLQTKDGTLPEALLSGLEWRGFGDPCQAGVICPIRPTKEEQVMGLLFLGLNPRRPYDNDYRQFISLLSQKLASQLAATVLLEEEARRGRNAAEQAAYDTAMLQRRLAHQTEQTNRSIQNFKAVAEFIPVGMSFSDDQGNVTFANDSWYRITGVSTGLVAPGALLERVFQEDRSKIALSLQDIKRMDVVTFEFRILDDEHDEEDDITTASRSTAALNGQPEKVWRHVLAHAKAERASDGTVVRILTCLTNVTVQKHAAEEAMKRAQEAENLKRLAEFATVGMYDMTIDGRLLGANKLFWELSGLPKVDLERNEVQPWPTCVVEEDLPVLESCMQKLKATGRPQTAEIKLKAPWTSDDMTSIPENITRWALATFMPVKNPEGVTESFTGCLSDVSLQKWQLEQEMLRKEEAIESKRQQENFIDMTSHEMRNPLSAIVHCTDAIIASLSRVQELDAAATLSHTSSAVGRTLASKGRSKLDEEKQLLEDSIENAETIVTCAQHQKRIVDDILTMSKLDSKLLAVTPFTVNPVEIVKDALKMFEVEARRVDIDLTSTVDNSYTNLGYDFLDFDPSRVKQVLINLLTNALKFTKSGKSRSVQVCLKGSIVPPGQDMTTVDFIPRFCDPADEYEQPALKGRVNPLYLLFEVKDTGQGLSAKEMRNLFNRFVQASAKTHVKYGGSGLGLFISRRLTELQNGGIGVSSREGFGSTFAFYVEAYIPNESARKSAEATAAASKAVVAAVAAGSNGTIEQKTRRTSASRRSVSYNRENQKGLLPINGILVVEDNLINQQITRRGLTERGYSVDVANHGVEAVDKLQRSIEPKAGNGSGIGSPKSPQIPIDLVLMDVEMPIQDGLTCTRHIRDYEEQGEVFCVSGGRIPIIAVTANARPEQISEAKAAGCDDVLVKPYRMPELIEKMQVVMRRLDGSKHSPHPTET